MKNIIKRYELEKVPLIFVIGEKEAQNQTFSLRSRKHGNLGQMDLPRLHKLIDEELSLGKPKYILD